MKKLTVKEAQEIFNKHSLAREDYLDVDVPNLLRVQNDNGFINGTVDGHNLFTYISSTKPKFDIWLIEGDEYKGYLSELIDLWEDHYGSLNSLPFGYSIHIRAYLDQIHKHIGDKNFYFSL